MQNIFARLDTLADSLEGSGLKKYAEKIDRVSNTLEKKAPAKFMKALKDHNSFISYYLKEVGQVPYTIKVALQNIMRSYLYDFNNANHVKQYQREIKSCIIKEVIEKQIREDLLKMAILNKIFK